MRSPARLFLIALLAALAAGAAVWAGSAPGGEGWRGESGGGPWTSREVEQRAEYKGLEKSRSVHFTVYSDFVDAEYVAKFTFDLEVYFSRLQREFWNFIPPRHREAQLEFFVFRDQAAFYEFGLKEGGFEHGKIGYLSTATRRAAILVQDEYHKDVTIAVHELTHIFNSFCAPRSPVWLDEGMAQFYSYFAAEEKGNARMKGGVNFAALSTIDQALKQRTMPRLLNLFRLGEGSFYDPNGELNFAAAWALVYYLRRGLGSDAEAMFGRFYALVAEGTDSIDAFASVYGASLDVIERVWLDYLGQIYRQGTPGQREGVPQAAPFVLEPGKPSESGERSEPAAAPAVR